MSYISLSPDETGVELAPGALGAAEAMRAPYRAATPFPHAVIDGFLDPALAERFAAAFPDQALASVRRANGYQNGKRGYRPATLGDHPAAGLLERLNAPPLVRLIEALTGNAALVTDPDFVGGGFHEIDPGGHLSIHADFRLHPGLGFARRVNLILFLNREWRPEWGGALELWERDRSGRAVAIEPIFNRAVIFDTDQSSFHGHPHPLACPPDIRRRSLALYFYNPAKAGERLASETLWHAEAPRSRLSAAIGKLRIGPFRFRT